MIKVIGDMGNEELMIKMSNSDFDALQRFAGIEYEERRKSNKIGMSVDSKHIEELYNAFDNLKSVKSEISGLLTKWQTVVSKINTIEATSKK